MVISSRQQDISQANAGRADRFGAGRMNERLAPDHHPMEVPLEAAEEFGMFPLDAANNNNKYLSPQVEEEDERGFLELQACIPHLAADKSASRLDILLEAINYIDTLHTTLLHKLRRGEMSEADRKLLLSQYLNNIITEANKEN